MGRGEVGVGRGKVGEDRGNRAGVEGGRPRVCVGLGCLTCISPILVAPLTFGAQASHRPSAAFLKCVARCRSRTGSSSASRTSTETSAPERPPICLESSLSADSPSECSALPKWMRRSVRREGASGSGT